MKKILYIFLLISPLLFIYSCDKDEPNQEPLYEIGEFAEGGIVFYVDETGQHGLVAAIDDLLEGATQATIDDVFDNDIEIMGYSWGCYGVDVSGAEGREIGTGYLNTIDIVNQNCQTQNGGLSAAEAALNYEYNGYNLPSHYELKEMFKTIGPAQPNTDYISDSGIGNLNNLCWYWSSSETSGSEAEDKAWGHGWFHTTLSFPNIFLQNFLYQKYHIRLVRPIRSF